MSAWILYHTHRAPGQITRREVELDPQVNLEEIMNREVELDPQVNLEEIMNREVPQVNLEEIMNREVELNPQVNLEEIMNREVPQVNLEEIMSREVELGCECCTSFASGCSSTAVQRTLSLWLCPARQLKQQLRGALVAAQWRGDTALTLPLFWRRSTVSPVFFGRYPRSSPLSPSLISNLASMDVKQHGQGSRVLWGRSRQGLLSTRCQTWLLDVQSTPSSALPCSHRGETQLTSVPDGSYVLEEGHTWWVHPVCHTFPRHSLWNWTKHNSCSDN